ncbi:hypothetical protein RRF57_013144 [Xylaria bambusicola]|uniref:Uncharacterized protein n=1 Tax=Xylaria bambusicola TaxID=326684 RepID=A0AAN7ZBA2_9PEZI
MGIVPGPKESQKTPGSKRRSTLDFSGLGPLKTTGTVGFSAFRDQETEAANRRKARRKSNGYAGGGMDDDSDEDDADEENPLAKMEDVDDKVIKSHLEPEDAKVTGELQAGIDRIRVSPPLSLGICSTVLFIYTNQNGRQLKRQHSAEPDSVNRKSPSAGPRGRDTTPPEAAQSNQPAPDTVSSLLSQAFTAESTIGSPMKKHRASTDGTAGDRSANFPSALGDVLGRANADQQMKKSVPAVQITEDEEL